MKEKFASLIEVKKIIAIFLTIAYIALTFVYLEVPQPFHTIFSVIIGYYFGQSTAGQAQIRTTELEKQE